MVIKIRLICIRDSLKVHPLKFIVKEARSCLDLVLNIIQENTILSVGTSSRWISRIRVEHEIFNETRQCWLQLSNLCRDLQLSNRGPQAWWWWWTGLTASVENQEKVLDPLPSFSSGSGPAPPTTVYQRFLGTQSEDETLGMTPRCSRARGKLHSINILHIIRWQFWTQSECLCLV